MTDELDKPLGKKKFALKIPKFKLNFWALPLGRAMGVISLLLLGGAVGSVLLFKNPQGGRPSVSVPISSIKDANPVAHNIADTSPLDDQAIEMPTPLAPDIHESAQPRAANDEYSARTTDDFEVFDDLQEDAKYGNIPRISVQGISPFDAYARPSISMDASSGKTLVAIVITGMGLNETTTVDAIERLPENVSMAFAPYGRSLQRSSLLARRQGHEVLLEIPMEPFDYPSSDPGPQTLLTGQTARKNLDNLYWLMARFGGYVGIMNNLGARFSSSAADFTPIMEELGTRGLAYLDDNTSNRSLSRQLATANQVPFARSSATLDSNPSRSAIMAALTKLEAQAKETGSAVGVISALPVSISTITSWAASLDERNVILVPVSTLMQRN